MTKEEFQESICKKLVARGYVVVRSVNKQPYNSKDMYFCPQSDIYSLIITPTSTQIEKIGNGGYRAHCSTQVKGPNDIDALHEEVNNIIFNGDQSSLSKQRKSGCLGTILFLIGAMALLIYAL